MPNVATRIVYGRGVIAAVHLDGVNYRRLMPASRHIFSLLTCGFPCCRIVKDASSAGCPWRVAEAGGMEGIIASLTRERNCIVPAPDGTFAGRTRNSFVSLEAVETRIQCATRIKGVLLLYSPDHKSSHYPYFLK